MSPQTSCAAQVGQSNDDKLNAKSNFRKVAQEKCRKVPAVDCFYVLKTVPDVECAPETFEDCIDVVKEVILAARHIVG